jgi:hypothetical protein
MLTSVAMGFVSAICAGRSWPAAFQRMSSRFAADSPLEGTGFELRVPKPTRFIILRMRACEVRYERREKRWCPRRGGNSGSNPVTSSGESSELQIRTTAIIWRTLAVRHLRPPTCGDSDSSRYGRAKNARGGARPWVALLRTN